jgi:beta-lactamase class A
MGGTTLKIGIMLRNGFILLLFLALLLLPGLLSEAASTSQPALYFNDSIASFRAFLRQRRDIIDSYMDTRHSVEKALEKLQSEFPGKAGAFFYDLKCRWSCGLDEDTPFPAASAIKLPIVVTAYDEAQSGRLDLGERLIIAEADKVGGSGILKEEPSGQRYTIRELAGYMITKSDNTATDALLKRISMEKINCHMKELGLKNTMIERTIFDFDALDRGLDNVMSPADMVRLFISLYDRRNDEPGQEMMTMLCSVERRDMLPALLPAKVPVAHKTGELAGTLIDGGIVLHGTHPFVLCLMGRDVTERDKAVGIFARLSRDVYGLIEGLAGQEDE